MNINTTANSYTSAPDYSNYSARTSQSASVTQTTTPSQELTRQSACQTTTQSAPSQSASSTFPASSPLAKLAEYTKVIDEHYAKANAENKRFSNPEKHIDDKYFNKKSRYYIKGLSDRERQICAESELRVLHGGHAAVNSYDPIIQSTFGGGILQDDEWQQHVRNGMNESISRLFLENGIEIPDDAELMLRVDPYEYKIHATGVDPELAEKIERVLNTGNNGKYLYEHLCWCDPANAGYERPRQYMENMAIQEKAVMWHFINDLTGYDVRALENRDGIIYTPDDQDLWDVMTKAFEKKQSCGQLAGVSLDSFYNDYQFYSKQGWNNEDNRGLTIGYNKNGLYDLDTEHGYGAEQNRWLQDLVNSRQQYWKDYQKNKFNEDSSKTGIIVQSSQSPANYSDGIQSILNAIQSKAKTSSLSFIQPNNECINLFYHLIKNGRVISLSDKVLSHSAKEVNTGFDALA